MAFSQAELNAAQRDPLAFRKILQRELDAGFIGAKSLPANYEVRNGTVEVKPPSFIEKYGWTLPLAAIGGGLALPALGGGAAATGAAGAGMGLNWTDIILSGGQLFGNLFGAHQQISAADKSADRMADATRYAADRGLESNREATAYAERQAALDRGDAEVNRRGNYDQWRAREGRIGTLGELAGLGPRDIPAYVPLGGGSSSGGMYPSRPENMPKAGEVDWTSPQLPAQLSAFFKARGVPDSEVPYWVKHAGELVARGKELNDPNYANTRLAAAEVFGGAGQPPAAPRSAAQVQPQPMTLGSMGGASRVPLSPALQAQIFLPPSLRTLAMRG